MEGESAGHILKGCRDVLTRPKDRRIEARHPTRRSGRRSDVAREGASISDVVRHQHLKIGPHIAIDDELFTRLPIRSSPRRFYHEQKFSVRREEHGSSGGIELRRWRRTPLTGKAATERATILGNGSHVTHARPPLQRRRRSSCRNGRRHRQGSRRGNGAGDGLGSGRRGGVRGGERRCNRRRERRRLCRGRGSCLRQGSRCRPRHG